MFGSREVTRNAVKLLNYHSHTPTGQINYARKEPREIFWRVVALKRAGLKEGVELKKFSITT